MSKTPPTSSIHGTGPTLPRLPLQSLREGEDVQDAPDSHARRQLSKKSQGHGSPRLMGTPPRVPPIPLSQVSPAANGYPVSKPGPSERQVSKEKDRQVSFDASQKHRISKGSSISGSVVSESDWSKSELGDSLMSGTSCTSISSRGILQSYQQQILRQPAPPFRQPSSPVPFADISTGQTMRVCFFPTKSDAVLTWGTKALSVVFLAGATLCTYFALEANGRSKSSQTTAMLLCTIALVLVLISVWIFLRIRSPSSLIIAQVNGQWSFILQRVGLSPVVRSLRGLEAFVETFGFCSQVRPGFVGKQVGHRTSRTGTVHLFFCDINGKPAMSFSCSLEDPLAFFLCLRDLTLETSHHLNNTTTDYVAQWDLDSNMQSHRTGEPMGSSRSNALELGDDNSARRLPGDLRS